MRLLRDDDLAVRLARNGRKACVNYAWPAVRSAWLEAYYELPRSEWGRERPFSEEGGKGRFRGPWDEAPRS